MNELYAVLCAYLIGALPVSYIIGRVFFKLDLREHGSGNLGATNAFRIMGAKVGVVTLMLDIGKGAAAVLLSRHLGEAAITPVLSGMAAIAGHNWPVYLKFKGGKGVATSAGVCLMLMPISFLFALIVTAATFWRSRYMSLASLAGAVALPLASIFQFYAYRIDPITISEVIFSLIAGAFVFIRHRANIGRLKRGEEKKMF
jgi:acyl phosphate:glycerol-3-phosphate acyltransferase